MRLSSASEAHALMLNAFANAKRLDIFRILLKGETAVTPLAQEIGLSQSAISQHLGKLRQLGLVTTRRDAQTIYYSTNNPAVRAIISMLDSLDLAEQTKLRLVG